MRHLFLFTAFAVGCCLGALAFHSASVAQAQGVVIRSWQPDTPIRQAPDAIMLQAPAVEIEQAPGIAEESSDELVLAPPKKASCSCSCSDCTCPGHTAKASANCTTGTCAVPLSSQSATSSEDGEEGGGRVKKIFGRVFRRGGGRCGRRGCG